MTEPKFTPGPWSVIKGRHFYEDRFGVEIKGDDFSIQPQMGMTEANAHLIAAAPELYEALEELLIQTRQYGHKPEIKMAEAALAKARGESHD